MDPYVTLLHTFQDEEGQWECKECPAGFYCDNGIEPVVNYTMYECPQGTGISQPCHIWLKL